MREIINKIKDNKIIKLLFMLLKAIVTLVIILIVSIIFVQRVSNNKVTLGGYSIFTIVTESMVPKYEVGDMLLAKKTSFDKIKVALCKSIKEKTAIPQAIKAVRISPLFSKWSINAPNP